MYVLKLIELLQSQLFSGGQSTSITEVEFCCSLTPVRFKALLACITPAFTSGRAMRWGFDRMFTKLNRRRYRSHIQAELSFYCIESKEAFKAISSALESQYSRAGGNRFS
jgi:hypothetical protein